MLHACLYTICFVFYYTLWRFYAFSGTNLLTRCHSASSLFSAVFVFQKSYTGNILRIGRNKSWTSYFYRSFAKIEDETEEGQEPGSPQGGAAQPLAVHPMVRPAGPTSDDALSPIKSPRWEKPKGRIVFFSKHTTSRRRRWSEIGRIQELFPAPSRRGESLPEAFSTTMVASRVMCE
jgi:hypothetical protein